MMRLMRPNSTISRVVLSLVFGVVVGVGTDAFVDHLHGLLAGIAAATLLFQTLGWVALWPLDARATRHNALAEQRNRNLDEVIVIIAEFIAMIGVVTMLLLGKTAGNQLAAALAVVAVFMSWSGLHLMYAIRYAEYYYRGTEGGIDFNAPQYNPSYRDFLYFSYNLGMTYQVSDTSVSEPRIRAIVLRHCLLSYIFGTVILATTVNLFVSFVSG